MAKTISLLVAAAAAGANGQFMSIMKSTSWVQGSDGRMHQETHEVRSEFSQDNDMMKKVTSDVDCIDGDCLERDSISLSTGGDLAMPPLATMAAFLGDLLPRRSAPDDSWRNEEPQMPSHLRGMLRDMGFVPLERKKEMGYAPLHMQQRMSDDVVVIVDDADMPRPPPTMAAVRFANHRETPDVDFDLLLGVFLAASSLFCGLVAVVRAFSVAADARELRDLEEPLRDTRQVPIAMPAAVPQIAQAVTEKEEQHLEEPTVAEPAFHFRPSVGTWLMHVEA